MTTFAVGANLTISPRRVTFDGTRRLAVVQVRNQGEAPATFDVAFIDRVMSPTGQIIELNDALADEALRPQAERLRSAKAFLRVTPRRIFLEPGKGEMLRIQLGPVEGKGEYRSHLTVTAVPPAEFGLTAEAASRGEDQTLRFRITSLFSLTIPVVVRSGEIDVAAAIENVRLEFASGRTRTSLGFSPTLSLEIVRKGTGSLFGNIQVRGASGEVLGEARGVGVYPEVERRSLRVALARSPGPGEKLTVTLVDDDLAPGRLLATATSP